MIKTSDMRRTEYFVESTSDFVGELQEAAWAVLKGNPGTDMAEWIELLFEQYPAEVIDALGTDEETVRGTLSWWWTCEVFTDKKTGMTETYRDWAAYFATERSVKLYEMLSDARLEIKRLERLSSGGRRSTHFRGESSLDAK